MFSLYFDYLQFYGNLVFSILWINVLSFFSQNTNLLPPKPKSSFRHLKQGIQEFHRKYVLVPTDKAANNVVVVCRLHYINTLKQELNGTKAYEETSIDEKSVVYSHSNEIPKTFAVDVKERQDRLPTMYWLPKLHKRPYKSNRKAMNRNWINQKANPALKTKAGNK